MSRFLTKIIATCFFIGYLPLIPGTFGSVVGLCIYIFLRNNLLFLVLTCSLLMISGFFLSGRAARMFGRRDPPQIIIDEIVGMMISLLGSHIYADKKLTLVVGFIIFRILDSIKPFPANRFQQRIGSLGIMGDDIVAGIYTNIVVHTIFLLKFIHGSI